MAEQILDKLYSLINGLKNISESEQVEFLEENIPEALMVERFSIFTLSPEDSRLYLLASFNLQADIVCLQLEKLLEKSIMFDSLYQRKYIYLPDFEHSRFFRGSEVHNYKGKECLTIPLTYKQKLFGIINLNDSIYTKFSDQQIKSSLIFAEYLSLFLSSLDCEAKISGVNYEQ